MTEALVEFDDVNHGDSESDNHGCHVTLDWSQLRTLRTRSIYETVIESLFNIRRFNDKNQSETDELQFQQSQMVEAPPVWRIIVIVWRPLEHIYFGL